MTRDRLKDFLDEVQAAFLSGDVETLGEYFVWPFVVYTIAGVTVVRGEVEFRKMAEQYLAALASLSVVTSEISIKSREPAMYDRLRVTVRVTDFNHQGESVAHGLVRYFLIQKLDGYEIEMLEYLEAPIPPEEVKRIVH